MTKEQPSTMRERFLEKFGSIKHRGFPQSAILTFIEAECASAREEGQDAAIYEMDEAAKSHWFQEGYKKASIDCGLEVAQATPTIKRSYENGVVI